MFSKSCYCCDVKSLNRVFDEEIHEIRKYDNSPTPEGYFKVPNAFWQAEIFFGTKLRKIISRHKHSHLTVSQLNLVRNFETCFCVS